MRSDPHHRRAAVLAIAALTSVVGVILGVAAAAASHGCAPVPMTLSWYQPVPTAPTGDHLPTDDPNPLLVPLRAAC